MGNIAPAVRRGMEACMIRMLIKNWWLLLLRGILAVAFAILIFVFLPFVPAPLLRELAFAGLVMIFALFAIVTGAITIAAAVRGAGQGGSAGLALRLRGLRESIHTLAVSRPLAKAASQSEAV